MREVDAVIHQCGLNMMIVRNNTRLRSALLALSLAGAASPALAGAGGLGKITTTFTELQTVMLALGVIVMTIAIMWAGYKMMFQHARWGDIAYIVIGGILVGGAVAFAGWFMEGA